MGMRANYVVVDDEGWRLYYSHWGARSVDLQLAAGPASALRFIRQQRLCNRETGWLNERWGEGGALVDSTRGQLKFFGGYESFRGLDYRRAYCALLAQTWSGWTVDWAFDELADFAAHVDVDPQVVRVPELVPARDAVGPFELERAADDDIDDGIWALLTVRGTDGQLAGWPVNITERVHLAWAGDGLLDLLADTRTGSDVITGQPPEYGLHIDVVARRMGFWTAATIPSLVAEARRRWPGWDVQFWQDRYEQQLELCDGVVRAPGIDVARGLDQFAARLQEPQWDTVPGALEMVAQSRAEARAVGLTAVIDSMITAHVEVDTDEQEQHQITAGLMAARQALHER